MLEAPANLGSQVVAWPPVASRMEESYERAKRLHEAHLPHLRDSDARIVKDLRTSGVSITSLQAMEIEGVDAPARGRLRVGRPTFSTDTILPG